MSLFLPSVHRALDDNGDVISQATWTFYLEDTTSLVSVYSDNSLTSPLTNPVVADAGGKFANIFIDDSVSYRAILKDSSGNTIKDIQPINSGGSALRAFRPEDYGAVGDGVTNDTAAFLLLSEAVNTAGGGVVELSAKTYIVGEQEVQTAEETAVHFYTFLPSYILKFVGLTDPLIIRGNGATLKAPDGYKFGTFLADGTATDNGSPYTGPQIAACYYAMIYTENCSGMIQVSDIDLNGNILNATIGGPWGNTGRQIPGSGFAAYDNTGCWRLNNVRSYGHGLDGIYVDDPGEEDTPISGSGTFSCRSYENGRQAMSIVGGCGHIFIGTHFNRTGKNTGSVSSAPRAGVDIEAENGKTVREIHFLDCEAVDNAGAGLLDGGGGASSDITWTGGSLIGTTTFGYYSGASLTGMRFERVLIMGDMNNLVGDEQFTHCRFSNELALSPTGLVNDEDNMLTYAIAGNLFDRCEFICNNVLGVSIGNFNGATMRDCRFISRLGTMMPFGYFTGNNRFIEEDTGTITRTPGGLVGAGGNGGDSTGIWRFTTAAGTMTQYPATVDTSRNRIGFATKGDADATLTVNTDQAIQRFTTTLTADRSITLSTTGAKIGSRFRIVRTAGGAFNLNVGTGPLKALATNKWCEVEYDGSVWVLTATGDL